MIEFSYKQKYGRISFRNRDGKVYDCNIYGGNCLAVITHVYKNEEGKDMEQLIMFFADERHIKNILNYEGKLWKYDKPVSCSLNMYFKNCNTLLKYFVKEMNVKCYYKEVKED